MSLAIVTGLDRPVPVQPLHLIFINLIEWLDRDDLPLNLATRGYSEVSITVELNEAKDGFDLAGC